LSELRDEIALADDLTLAVERRLSGYVENCAAGNFGNMSVADWRL
jgi:hypothetical protein